MDRKEATEFLHKSMGYSRRMSAKLVDIALLQKSNSVIAFALREAIEKARTKGAKDIKRKK
jgi:hypothetical protein